MLSKPGVRVVVLNRNGGGVVLRALRSLTGLAWPRERLNVIVVDNGSTDGSVAALRDRFPAVEVLDAGSNLGFAGGNNLGLARARRTSTTSRC